MNEITPLSIEEMKQKEMEYSAYIKVGGFLSPADYEETKKYILQIKEMDSKELKTELYKSNVATRTQFENLCKIAGAEVSPAQRLLYCYLQRYERVRDKDGPIIREKSAGQADQAVFANCLLLSGANDLLVKYMVSLPHIFTFIRNFGDSPPIIEQNLSQAITSYSLLREKMV